MLSRPEVAIDRGTARPHPGERAFFAVLALLFAASAAATLVESGRMAAMSAMPMPGGWTMSMMWMRMPGQTWGAAAAAFVGMWSLMMLAMMLPSLTVALRRYRHAVSGTGQARVGYLTLFAGAGYFAVWTLLGLVVFPLGLTFAALAMDSSVVAGVAPIVAGLIVAGAGALQFTKWKSHHLTCCRNPPGPSAEPANLGTAWRYGMRLGLHCCYCCSGLTAILLVVGVMNPIAMMLVTVAITAERLADKNERIVQAIGALAIGTGVLMVGRALL